MKIAVSAVLALLAALSSPAQDLPPPQPAPARQKVYTAQQKARVAVMPFQNTNELAQQQKYGESVSAMLATFLKRKSQLVVVDRQILDKIMKESALDASGATSAPTADADPEKSIERI